MKYRNFYADEYKSGNATKLYLDNELRNQPLNAPSPMKGILFKNPVKIQLRLFDHSGRLIESAFGALVLSLKKYFENRTFSL